MRPQYPPEDRQQLVELVRAGRSPKALAREFEPSEQTIRNWVKQAALDGGQRTDGLTTDEREEVRRLRRENRQLKLEREILKKARPGLLGKRGRCPSGIRVRESEPGLVPGATAVSRGGPLAQRVLRLAPPPPLASRRRE